MFRRPSWFVLLVVLCAAGVSPAASPAAPRAAMPDSLADNPLLAPWTTPFGVPPFDRIREAHYLPAFRAAIAMHDREIDAIVGQKAAPTFENTIVALDRSGLALQRVNLVFGGLSGAETTPGLQALAKETAPMLSAHRDDVALNAKLFARVKAVWDGRAKAKLAPDQTTLLERTYKDFVRGGAMLDAAGQKRLRELNAELATTSVTFRENLLQETNGYQLVISNRDDLAGLPERVVAGAADAAAKAGKSGQWLFTLQAPSLWPFLQYSARRELRRQIFSAYIERANGGAHDNNAALAHIAALRAERAQMLGYATHADFVLAENMAKTPAAVDGLLQRVWKPALAVAAREAADLQAALRADDPAAELQPWDWFYYAEKVRQSRYALDEGALRPYFALDRVREGVFDVAHRLYGLSFEERKDLPVYHPEVRAFEVKDADGSHLAIFYCDYHPRPGKRSGAWSGTYVESFSDGDRRVRPVIVNVCNFSRPTGGDPALLSLEEAETLFHEFGHALHSMLSRVRYRGVARTPQDFVELPSQVMENWVREPDVLERFAKHFRTGEVIPDSLVRKMLESRRFNQGFATTEYVAASLLDMRWHTQTSTTPVADPAAFEREAMRAAGLPPSIVPRYRSPYFQHVFAGGYSAGYYSYLWAEVLDADAFGAFREKGIFDPATAASFRTNVLEKGGSEDVMELYRRFRGRAPSEDALLERRGLR